MKQTKKSSKRVSLALVFCMVLMLMLTFALPVSATETPEVAWGVSADELTGSGTLYDARVVAYNGTATYFRLQKDITLESVEEPWILSTEITLDLAGYTLTTVNGFGVISGGLILEDTVGGGAITASTNAAIWVSTSSDEFSTVTIKGGTLTGKQAILATSPCEVYLVGGTLSGTQYGDVHISDASTKVVVTGSTFTSSVAAFAYGSGGELDLSDATGDAYTINVVGSMMLQEMALEKVLLPDDFALFGDDGSKITDAPVPAGKLVTAQRELPADGNGAGTGNTGNTDNTDPDNTGNTDNGDDDGGFPILAVVAAVLVGAAATAVALLLFKKKKDKES